MKESGGSGRRVSAISIALNGAFAVIKLVAGIAGNSYALVADAVESLSDVISSVIVWGGVVIASRPADASHPYGHGKAEPLAALAVAVMLVGAALGIAVQAVERVGTPHDVPAAYTLVVLLAVIVAKEAMYRYEARVARQINSTVVFLDAWHHRSDALSSAAAAIGITVALLGGDGYEAADDWAALAACLVIVWNGARFARTAVAELMDATPRTALADRMRKVVVAVEGARHVEKVLVRKMGPDIYVDLHLEVDPALSVHKAHQIAHDVKDALRVTWPNIADVLVHVEPHGEAAGDAPGTG